MKSEILTVQKFVQMINGSTWAIVPERFKAFIDSFMIYFEKHNEITIDDNQQPPEKERFERIGKVAKIDIHGVTNKRHDSEWGGLVSTERLKVDIQAALDDNSIETIFLDYDSPGGMVDGCKEFSDFIFNAREQKDIIAYANGMMASAAYYSGSAAHEVFAFDDSEVGSIGTLLVHADYSGMFKDFGIDITVIRAGKYKALGDPYTPLSKTAKDVLQSEVDYFANLFKEDVARNRGVSFDTVDKEMAEGRVFIGQQALDVGLIDGIETKDSIIESINNQNNNFTGGSQMLFGKNKNNQAVFEDGVELTADSLKSQGREVYDSVFNTGKDSAKTENETAMNGMKDQIKNDFVANAIDIFAIAGEDQGELALSCIGNGMSKEQAAVKLLEDFKKNGTGNENETEKQAEEKKAKKEEMRKFAESANQPVENAEEEQAAATAATATWDKDEKLQKKFTSKGLKKEDYLKAMATWNRDKGVRADYMGLSDEGNTSAYLANYIAESK